MKNWRISVQAVVPRRPRRLPIVASLRLGGVSGLLLVMALLVIGWPGQARADDPMQLAGRIQQKYASIRSFTASFSQSIRNAASGDTERRSGSFSFKKPLLVRWETVKPEKELLLIGATAVWDYFEEDKEAYRYAVEEIIGSKTMLRFLTGQAKLTEDFHVAVSREPAGPGQAVLDLAPKEPEPGLVMARIWVDTATDLIVRIHIQDFYANANDLSLTDLVVNPKLADNLFVFSPPKDVKIRDNASAKGRGSAPVQGRDLQQ